MRIRCVAGPAPCWALLAVGFVCACAPASAFGQSVIRPLILSDRMDQTALGSGLIDGRPDGVYSDFFGTVIGSNGLIAFEGVASYFPDDNNLETPEARAGIWVIDAATGMQRRVMISGMPAPGTTGNFTSGFSEVRIDSLGNVLFDASAPVLAYYHATPAGQLNQVLRQSQPVPRSTGLLLGDIRLGTGFVNNGHIILNEPIVNQGFIRVGTGALRWDGNSLTPIVVPEMAVPGAPPGTVFTTGSALVNSSGDNLIFTATRTGTITTPAYWRSTAGVLSPVVRVGDAMPGFPFFEPTINTLHSADINNAGQVAFSASGADGPFDFSAIYRTAATGLDLVVARGAAAPNSVAPATFFNFLGTAINGAGNIAFIGNATGVNNGLWVARPNSSGDTFGISNVAVTSQSIFDPTLPANATFANLNNAFGAFNFNSLDQVAFMAKLAGTGINALNDDSLWFYDPVDGLKLIARENSPFLVGEGDLRLVKTIEFTTSGTGGQDGRPTGLSDEGLLVFSLAFNDNSDGIFLYGPPPTGDGFFWRGPLAIDTNWHTLLGSDTNWEDDRANIHATPPGQAGIEAVTIDGAPNGVVIDQQDVNIGSLTAPTAQLTLRRRLQLNTGSSLGSIILDRPESELHLDTDLTLVGPGSIWTDGAITADTAAILAGDAKLIVAEGAQLDVKTNAQGLGSRTLAAPLIVRGRVVQHDGTWTLNETININGGVLEVRDGSLFGSAFVNNAGRLEKTTDDTFDVLVPFNSNNGVIAVKDGTLKFTRNGLHSGGRYELTEGATLEFDLGAAGETNVTADLFVGGELGTGNPLTGSMRLLSGNYLAANGVTATFALRGEGLKLEGGKLGGPGVIENRGVMRWTGGSIENSGNGQFKNTSRVDVAEFDNQTVKLTGRFVNEADVNQGSDGGQGGQFIVDGANIQNSGRWDLLGGSFVPTGAPSAFNNIGGTLNVEFSTTLNIPVNNSNGGEIRAQNGTLTLAQPAQHTGSGAFVLAGGLITITGDQTFNGDHEIRGTGRFRMQGADLDIQSGQLKYAAFADTSVPAFSGVDVSGDGTLLIATPVGISGVDVDGGHIRNESSDLMTFLTRIEDNGEIRNAGTMRPHDGVLLDSGGKLINLDTGLLKLVGGRSIVSFDDAKNSELVNEGGRIELEGTQSDVWSMATPVELIGGSVQATRAKLAFQTNVAVTAPAVFSARAGGGFVFEHSPGLEASVELAGGTLFEGDGTLRVDSDLLIVGGDVIVAVERLFSAVASTIDGSDGRLINRSNAGFDFVTIGRLRNEAGLANPSHQMLLAHSVLKNEIENAGRMSITEDTTFDSTLRFTNETGASLTIDDITMPEFGSRLVNDGYLRWETGSSEDDARNLVFDNPGTLDLGPAAQLKLEATRVEQIVQEGSVISTLALTGGTWTFQPGSLLTITHFNTEILPLTRSQADITLIRNGRILNFAVEFLNQGDLRLLQGTNLSFSGEFENDGFLFIDPSSSLTAGKIDNDGTFAILGTVTGDIAFTSSSEFSGTGTVNGSVITAGATLPGQSPGLLTINGDFTQESSASLIIEIAGTELGSQYDSLLVTGIASIDGLLGISLLDGFVPASSDTFTILQAGSLIGTFDNAPAGAFIIPGSGTFDVQYSGTAVILSNFQGIPEPSSLAILALLSPLLLRRRPRVRD